MRFMTNDTGRWKWTAKESKCTGIEFTSEDPFSFWSYLSPICRPDLVAMRDCGASSENNKQRIYDRIVPYVLFLANERKLQKKKRKQGVEFESNEQCAMNRVHSSFGNNRGNEITGNAKKYAIHWIVFGLFFFFLLFMRITEHQQVPVTENLHHKFEKVFFFVVDIFHVSIVLRLLLCNIHQSIRAENTQRRYCALHSRPAGEKKYGSKHLTEIIKILDFLFEFVQPKRQSHTLPEKNEYISFGFGCSKPSVRARQVNSSVINMPH